MYHVANKRGKGLNHGAITFQLLLLEGRVEVISKRNPALRRERN